MSKKKRMWLYIMIAFYIVTGILHFLKEPAYERVVPPWLPYPALLVYISGICEFGFALLLIPSSTRRIAAWLIILLLIAVFPANIQMSINYWHEGNRWFWVSILRLPLQLVLIRWAWPYARKSRKKIITN